MKKIVTTLAMISLFGVGLATAGDADYIDAGKNIISVTPPPAPCFSYDFFDLNYVFQDFDNRRAEGGQAWGLNFSKSLGDVFYVTGAYDRAKWSADYSNYNQYTNVRSDRYRFGVGARYSVLSCLDLTFEGGGSYQDYRFESWPAENNFDRWGWYAGPGIRGRLGKNVEFYGNAFYSAQEGLYGWRFTPGIILNVTEAIGLKMGAEFENEVNSLLLGVRLYY